MSIPVFTTHARCSLLLSPSHPLHNTSQRLPRQTRLDIFLPNTNFSRAVQTRAQTQDHSFSRTLLRLTLPHHLRLQSSMPATPKVNTAMHTPPPIKLLLMVIVSRFLLYSGVHCRPVIWGHFYTRQTTASETRRNRGKSLLLRPSRGCQSYLCIGS